MTIQEMQADMLAKLYAVTCDAVEDAKTAQEAMSILRESSNAFSFAMAHMKKDG